MRARGLAAGTFFRRLEALEALFPESLTASLVDLTVRFVERLTSLTRTDERLLSRFFEAMVISVNLTPLCPHRVCFPRN